MKIRLLLLLCLPLLATAQYYNDPSHQIQSDAYRQKVKTRRVLISAFDSVFTGRSKVMRLSNYVNSWSPVSDVKEKGTGTVEMFSAVKTVLTLSGNYTTGLEWSTSNRKPATQEEYVQGRPLNGAATWQGPETNEMFSYGPSLHTLEYDGSSYPYDNNGKLVPKGTGNGRNANAYNNGLLKTGLHFSQKLNIKGTITRHNTNTWGFGLALEQGTDNTTLRYNKNTSSAIRISAERYIHRFTIKGSYSGANNHSPFTNRSGYLNQAYSQSLLTPVSFNNTAGTNLGNAQRSYSNLANNPGYMLENNTNNYNQTQQTGGLSVAYNYNKLKAGLSNTLLHIRQQDKEVYKPGSAGWPDGITTERYKKALNYTQKAELLIPIKTAYHQDYTIQLQNLFTYEQTDIRYISDSAWHYRRPSDEMMLNFTAEWKTPDVEMKLITANKSYTSGTTSRNSYWLPAVSWSLSDGYSNYSELHYRITASFSRFNSELPLQQSIAGFNLFQYDIKDALQYRPVLEISSYKQIAPIEHTEWALNSYIWHGPFSLQTDFYFRQTHNDIYPVLSNGSYRLQNIADIRKQGMELTISYQPPHYQQLWFAANISFNSYRNKVTHVQNGYNNAPLGGFSNVYTSIIQGQPFGVITGNDFVKDAAGKMVIGNDGFPLAGTGRKIIGNPNPDFIAKSGFQLSWKVFALSLDMEWKKGGVMWNGTQAVLDYYGRSANSAAARNITGYVFNGVNQNGAKNTTAVSFYDPAQPVENNRWVRYGLSGVAADYIQRADYIRINHIQLNITAFRLRIRHNSKPVTTGLYAHNLLLWSPYRGADPRQTLFEQTNTTGLDYFNLPSFRSYGCNLSIQF